MAQQAPVEDPLKESLALRMPVFKRDTSRRLKLDTLEEYMLLTAYAQGKLASARNEAREELDTLDDQWAVLPWEHYAAGKPKTNDGMEAARSEANPDLAKRRRVLQKRIVRLSEEIERMERDAKVCSRAYTFMMGE